MAAFPPRVDDAVACAIEHRVLPVEVPGGSEQGAGRPQDLLDIEGIVARHGATLDVDYVRRWLRELAAVAEDPEVSARFERIWAERRAGG